MKSAKAASAAILDWYDEHARVMPWRVSPASRVSGQCSDPYSVWLSEVMLQQTTVAAVTGYFLRFTARWPNVQALAAAEDGDVMGEWAGLGYYARARNLLKCARVVSNDLGGRFPDNYPDLMALPGIGPYTAAAIAAIAFDRPEVVVDGNVERVIARLFNISTPLPAAKPELKDKAALMTPDRRPGDYAQAVMDLGATICTPRSPTCDLCAVRRYCSAHRAGTAAELPKRVAKKPKPVRQGIVYLARNPQGAWLLERRPDKGLLGGMLGWPTSDWSAEPVDLPPFPADWQTLPTTVRHTFTHFHLILNVKTATVPEGCTSGTGFFVPEQTFRASDLPTVMRKAYALTCAT